MAACRERCWRKDWVIDLDVQKFFDSVPWDLVIKAVEANTDLWGSKTRLRVLTCGFRRRVRTR